MFDPQPAAVEALVAEGATGASDLAALVRELPAPRAVWVMVPAGHITESVVAELTGLLEEGDCLIDGGNSYYRDDIRRGETAAAKGIDYLDVGTSGGVWGRERGFCLMIGGPDRSANRLAPLWDTIAPGFAAAERTAGPRGRPDPGGARLAALRPERGGPLRQDGPQRHRVRPDGGVRRGAQRPQARERRHGQP